MSTHHFADPGRNPAAIQTQCAFTLIEYADDNEDWVSGNQVELVSNAVGDENRGGWVVGNAQRDATDENLRKGDLWPYVSAARLYHCPGDRSLVTGKPGLPRFRSYGLEGNINARTSSDIWSPHILRKTSEIIDPANNFGFVDVAAGSIHGGAFGMGWGGPGDWRTGPFVWVHRPSDRHGRAANLSFLDGSVQTKRWGNPSREKEPLRPVPPRIGPDRDDFLWLGERTHVGQYRNQ